MPSSLHAAAYRELMAFLVESRKAANVSQVELGLRLEKPQSYISKVERGERRIDVIEFTAWMEALGAKAPDALVALLARIAKA